MGGRHRAKSCGLWVTGSKRIQYTARPRNAGRQPYVEPSKSSVPQNLHTVGDVVDAATAAQLNRMARTMAKLAESARQIGNADFTHSVSWQWRKSIGLCWPRLGG